MLRVNQNNAWKSLCRAIIEQAVKDEQVEDLNSEWGELVRTVAEVDSTSELHSVKYDKQGYNRVPAHVVAKVEEYLKAGYGYIFIQRQCGVSSRTISNIRKRMNECSGE